MSGLIIPIKYRIESPSQGTKVGKRSMHTNCERRKNCPYSQITKSYMWKIPENLQKSYLNYVGLAGLQDTKSIYKIIVFLCIYNEQLEIRILKNPNRIMKSKYLEWYCYIIEAENRFNTMNKSIILKTILCLMRTSYLMIIN